MLTLKNLFKSTHCGRPHLTNYVSLRWKSRPRKPFWMGLAKTKLFNIPEKKVIPPDEFEEIERLNYVYNRQANAIHNFMKNSINIFERMSDFELKHYLEEAESLHVRWNAESAKLREERLKIQEEKAIEKISNEIAMHEKKLKLVEAQVEEIVKKEIENSKTYITEENLDEAIDKCLESVSDYNYAMDLSGNIYKGDSMKPVESETWKVEMVHKKSIGEMKDETTKKL